MILLKKLCYYYLWDRSKILNFKLDVFSGYNSKLNKFWSEEGCLIMQPYDTEKGAGTMNPHTFLRAIGPEPWSVAWLQSWCRRPTDGRFM